MIATSTVFSPLRSAHLQKLFIILAVAAYALQAASYLTLYFRLGSSVWQSTQYTLMVASIVLLPIVLFFVVWYTAKQMVSRRERLFKALTWATIGVTIEVLLGLLYRLWLQRYIPYDGTHWYESWITLLPSLVSIVVVLSGAIAVGHTTRISLAVYRSVAALAVLAVVAYNGVFIFRDVLHQHLTLPNALYFSIGAFALGVILLVNYLLTTKEQDSFSTRLYVSTVYVIIGGFIFTILSAVWLMAGQLGMQWVYSTIMNDALVILGLLLYGSVLFWHKRQHII